MVLWSGRTLNAAHGKLFKCRIKILCAGLILTSLVFFWNFSIMERVAYISTPNAINTTVHDHVKTIAYQMVTQDQLPLPDENVYNMTCGGYKCVTKEVQDADMAVFFTYNLDNQPPKRQPNQLWLFYTGESQISIPSQSARAWDGLFNYSITFKKSSQDFVKECGLMFARAKSFQRRTHLTKRNFAKEKRKLCNSSANALWLVSNCNLSGRFRVRSGRLEYARELSKYINIDTFTGLRKSENVQDDCALQLGGVLKGRGDQNPKYRDYWFYLSFENSLCEEYITEKFWKILQDNSLTIPVVMGGLNMADYSRIAPTNSYIDVRNFTSPQHLAEHLKFVTENDDAFNYYHEWRNYYEMPERDSKRFCKSPYYLEFTTSISSLVLCIFIRCMVRQLSEPDDVNEY